MPAKGSHLYFGNKEHLIDRKLYRKFLKTRDVELSYADFVSIIKEGTKDIADVIAADPMGFKFPLSLGYVVVSVSPTKSNKRKLNVPETVKEGEPVYYTNFHSEGKIAKIKWYNDQLNNFIFSKIYKFKPCRILRRDVARSVKSGTQFFKWSVMDFIRHNKLTKAISKITTSWE